MCWQRLLTPFRGPGEAAPAARCRNPRSGGCTNGPGRSLRPPRQGKGLIPHSFRGLQDARLAPIRLLARRRFGLALGYGMRLARDTLGSVGGSMGRSHPGTGTEELGQPPNPRARRRRLALVYSLFVVVGIAQAWMLARLVERHDFSPAVAAGSFVPYVITGYSAWQSSRGRLNEPPLKLDLARAPPDEDPAK